MNVKELADRLNGRQYLNYIDKWEAKEIKKNDLVVVFGGSDDLMEFRGAIDDEIGVYGGGTAYFDKNGIIRNCCNDSDCPYFKEKLKGVSTIEALWCIDGKYSWKYKTEIPHECFEIFEDNEPYCIGIVFNLRDVK